MSVNASCQPLSQENTVSSLLGGRAVRRPQQEEAERLQEAAMELLEQQQSVCGLLREVEKLCPCSSLFSQDGDQTPTASGGVPPAAAGSLLVCELRRQATQLGVPVAVLSVKVMLERLMEITGTDGDDRSRELLTSSQRVQLGVLLESSRDLLSQGVICPKLLWQEYRRDQRLPSLELVYHLHMNTFLSLSFLLESDEGSRVWLVSRLKALCSWTLPQDEEETLHVRQKVLSLLVGVLVGSGFDLSCEPAASDRRISLLCSSVLDEMLFWLLDTVDKSPTLETSGAGAELWIQTYDASLCGVSTSAEATQRFFTHCLTQTLTHRPRLAVSEAVALQNEWTFAKASRLLTSLFHKLSVVFSAEQLLLHLQQVLETHEVNWKHVLSFLSTLLVYNPCTQPSLNELLSRLLSSAFEGYDLEHMIMAFLCARQASLEGTSIFSSYTDWFKMSFGGSSSQHAGSKKSLVFLLKFLSDLVPFEPPQYLKVHILHPPYVPVKHRSLLMEYVSLAKTRLADLKESVEDMGLYEDLSGAGGSSLQPQCQAVQDVEKAVTLFENTGRISATVMEASIFRRPYFLTRFLPALLKPRVLPVKADAWMSLIEALKKADKIPAAQYSSYVESCQRQRQRQQDKSDVCLDSSDDPLDVLNVQLRDFRELLPNGDDGEVTAQLSRISHTLSVIFPGRPDDLIQHEVIRVHVDTPMSSELHVRVISVILRNFCQCIIDASRANPPNKQNLWASRFVSMLLGNTQLLSGLIHRLWDLFQNQGSSLSGAHILGLAAFVVHLHVSVSNTPLIQLPVPLLSKPVPVGEAVGSALVCSTRTDMVFCVRLCVAAVCYGMCRGDSLPQQQQQDYILSCLYKKLLYLIPRLLPEVRRIPVSSAALLDKPPEQNVSSLWSSTIDPSSSWRESARRLWSSAAFHQLHDTPQYQLSFCDWLENELRVQRHDDALSDPERQEYQQWACLELYWPRPEEHGGCGGDMKILCSRLLDSIMDQHLVEKTHHRGASASGTCLPDIMSRLQEFVCEMEVSSFSSSCRGQADMCHFLFEFVSRRCSSTHSLSVSTELSLQHTLHAWNRVLLTLPPQLLIQVKAVGGRMSLDCTKLIEHVNQHQRQVCSPAGFLSYHLTSHFLRGVLRASLCCPCPREEVNKAWCQISLQCPLLLVSTVRWWECVSPVLVSVWSRVRGAEPLSEQLQLLTASQLWANSVACGSLSPPMPPAPAPALLLASSLHSAWRRRWGNTQGFRAALDKLRAESDTQLREVLVSLFFLSVNEYVSVLLYPQEKNHEHVRCLCSDLLWVLVDSSDWLLIFKSSEQGVYRSVTMVTSDEFTRLMPWAFYSLLLQQREELLHRVVRCPGFLQTAVLCYVSLLQLFLDGHTSTERQSAPSQILSNTKSFLLRVIAQTPPAALSSGQLRQLESQCADVDPEVAAALSVHVSDPSLSPEMDFL